MNGSDRRLDGGRPRQLPASGCSPRVGAAPGPRSAPTHPGRRGLLRRAHHRAQPLGHTRQRLGADRLVGRRRRRRLRRRRRGALADLAAPPTPAAWRSVVYLALAATCLGVSSPRPGRKARSPPPRRRRRHDDGTGLRRHDRMDCRQRVRSHTGLGRRCPRRLLDVPRRARTPRLLRRPRHRASSAAERQRPARFGPPIRHPALPLRRRPARVAQRPVRAAAAPGRRDGSARSGAGPPPATLLPRRRRRCRPPPSNA